MIELLPWLAPVYLVAVAIPLARTDIRWHRLPNRLTLPALPIALVSQLVAAIGLNEWSRFGVAAGCALLAFVVGLGINRTGALGMGDVKLVTATTWALAWFDPIKPVLALGIAFAVATVVVLFLFATQKARMGSSIALGPYLLVGFVTALALSF